MSVWSPQQDRALLDIAAWRKEGCPGQVFRMFGYAGTGKTTLARHIAHEVSGLVLFGAYTGKAALVLRSKGCGSASTIHSMIYTLEDEEDGIPHFILNDDSEVKDAEMVIIDECSMVDQRLGRDLLSFGTPVLVLGDPAQLPPVNGGGFFTNAEPNVMLTEVHRQAKDSPIITMATTVREGGQLTKGVYGGSRVISRKEVDREEVMRAGQVLVGMNRTRRLYNGRMRTLLGRDPAGPELGDKLVCLKNNHTKGTLNGSLWSVDRLMECGRRSVRMIVGPENAGGIKQPVEIKVRREFFAGDEKELTPQERKQSDEFDYGYALTVHKSQGSQWDNVVLFDESGVFREDRNRWLYTGVTRAAENLTVVAA